MKNFLFILLVLVYCQYLQAQKKPLDHTVYDNWQHIGERMISNDGKWVVYTIDPQLGDNELVIQSTNTAYKKTVPRGYSALITEDSRFVVFKIKPFYKETREAKIKRKKPDDMPKDSLAIVELGKEEIWKKQAVKTYKMPKKGFGWVTYQLEKSPEPAKTRQGDYGNKKFSDSLLHVIDSLQQVIETMPKKKKKKDGGEEEEIMDADGDETGGSSTDTGTDLIVRNIENGNEIVFKRVLEYYFNDTGEKVLLEQSRNPKDSLSSTLVLLFDVRSGITDTLSKGGNDFRNFAITEDGSQVAYVAERDAKPKDLQKYYRLWYYKSGMDSSVLLADRLSPGMKLGMTVSEYGSLNFSKSGKRLFFAVAPVQPPKDTSLVDFEHAKLDIWHYNDDYLQTVQTLPARLRAAQQENYLALYDLENGIIKQLGSKELPQIVQTEEGDGKTFYSVTDYGKRVEGQWLGTTRKDIYAIDVKTGRKKLVKENLHGQLYPSPSGNYIMWYDRVARNYFVWDGRTARNITEKIKVPLYSEEYDLPDHPTNYGVMGWHEGDSAVYIYDRYDIWKILPDNSQLAENITKTGRVNNDVYRYVKLNNDEKYFKYMQSLCFRFLNNENKTSGIRYLNLGEKTPLLYTVTYGSNAYSSITKSKAASKIFYTKESFSDAPDLYINDDTFEVSGTHSSMQRVEHEKKLSSINPQQKDYWWGTAELFKWKAYNGKGATGIVYKPENFDPKKKYPVIVYFYEKLSDDLHEYKEPAPIRSAVNVPYFVSNGYIIFMPDIEYKTGYPAQSAYDFIVSGARALVKQGWADSTKMTLQGHSWGGYQAAQLATMTSLFKAVWAGAPVANMTSAYGGIRWQTGINRQFQYEKTQSRIGATLWEKPELYIKNSPLFQLDKVTAPMVILHNDADGAVPWYQGIELFTGLRRLGKKVWMLNYNGQGHGLTQRQDMMDYHIRMQQFFDWILKEEKPAKWITEGVPAVKKGKDWGFEIIH